MKLRWWKVQQLRLVLLSKLQNKCLFSQIPILLFDAIFVFHKVPLLHVKCRIVSIIAYSKIISGFEISKMIVFFLKFVNIVERSYCCFPNRQQR